MGVDGTGKTTSARRLYDRLARASIPVKYRHEFKYFLLRVFTESRMAEPARRKFHAGVAEAYYEKRAVHSRWLYCLWPFVVWLDCALECIICKLFKSNVVVIHDRYIYDLLLAWERRGYANSVIRRLYLSNFLKPDFPLILDASPKTMFERKKEDHIYTLEFYVRERQKYLALARHLGFPVINTERESEVVLTQVINEFVNHHSYDSFREKAVIACLSNPCFDRSTVRKGMLRGPLNWQSMTEFLRHNRWGFYVLTNKLESYRSVLPLDVLNQMCKIHRILQERYMCFWKTLSKVVRLLNDREIKFVLIQIPLNLPYIAKDIDIVIEEDRFDEANRLLADIYNERDFDRTDRTVTFEDPIECPLELHSRISWFGVKVLDERDILRTAKKLKVNGLILTVPSAEYELLIALAHRIFGHFTTGLADLAYLHRLISCGNVNWDSVRQHAERFKWDKALMLYLSLLLPRLRCLYDDPPDPASMTLLMKHGLDLWFFHPLRMLLYLPVKLNIMFLRFIASTLIVRRLLLTLKLENSFLRGWLRHNS